MIKQFYFLSGLPRSGSTLLGAILNQHPDIFVSPTSPMLDILVETQNTWNKLQSVIANPEPVQLPNILKSIINSIWSHISKPIIIDKNRGWGKNMPSSTIIFEEEIKVLFTTRDLPSIMASWLVLLNNNIPNSIDVGILKKGFPITDENRMAEMWFGMMQDCMEIYQQVKIDASNRLFLISYDELVINTESILCNIETFLNVKHFKYNLTNIKSEHKDNDLMAWGLDGMHTIRPTIKKTSKDAIDILGTSLYNRFIELESKYT